MLSEVVSAIVKSSLCRKKMKMSRTRMSILVALTLACSLSGLSKGQAQSFTTQSGPGTRTPSASQPKQLTSQPNVFGGQNYSNGTTSQKNVFGGQNYSNGVTSQPNVFGGQNYSNGVTSQKNAFGGQNYSNGVKSQPNVLGGQNYSNGVTSLRNVFGGQNYSAPSSAKSVDVFSWFFK